MPLPLLQTDSKPFQTENFCFQKLPSAKLHMRTYSNNLDDQKQVVLGLNVIIHTLGTLAISSCSTFWKR